jgi:hypothetical protein
MGCHHGHVVGVNLRPAFDSLAYKTHNLPLESKVIFKDDTELEQSKIMQIRRNYAYNPNR